MPASVTLSAISALNVNQGGWSLACNSNPAPKRPEQGILLQVGENGAFVDVTEGFGPNQTVALLEALAHGNLWGRQVPCRAMLVEFTYTRPARVFSSTDGRTVVAENWGITVLAESAVRTFASPVTPFGSPNPVPLRYGRTALVDLGRAQPRIPYCQPVNGEYVGSLLTPAINGRYYFTKNCEGNRPFDTDAILSGLDCTTYILTAYNCAASYNQGDGSDIASCLGAHDAGCGTGTWSKDQMLEFLPKNREGEFIIWVPGHHAVMMVDAWVREYTPPAGGYRVTYCDDWIRKSPHQQFIIQALPGTTHHPVNPQSQAKPGVSIGAPVGGAQPAGTVPSPGNGNNGGGSNYTVVSGDSLSKITGKFWGDVLLWPILHDANRQVVGSDPNKIYPGQKLSVPNIKGYSSGQLSDARARGRNC